MKKYHVILIAISASIPLSAASQAQSRPDLLASVEVPSPTITIHNLQQAELDYQSTAWWTDLRDEHLRLLSHGDVALRRQVLLNMIYLANYYPEKIRFGQQLLPLYYTYRFDRDESIRILALSAISAIGKDASIRNLARHVRFEPSARVRRLTEAAVADYYARRDRN